MSKSETLFINLGLIEAYASGPLAIGAIIIITVLLLGFRLIRR